jgi:hypothetical protein
LSSGEECTRDVSAGLPGGINPVSAPVRDQPLKPGTHRGLLSGMTAIGQKRSFVLYAPAAFSHATYFFAWISALS